MNISDFRALDEHAEAFAVTMKAEKVSEEFIKTILDCARGARLVGNS